MREKLIELQKTCCVPGKKCTLDCLECMADHLLANGVIVLPCKVGQKLYVAGTQDDVWQIKECEAEEFAIDERGGHVLVCFECDNDCEGCPFNSWSQDYSGEWSCDGEYGQSMIGFADFGKTVFLTREDAEAALKEGQG